MNVTKIQDEIVSDELLQNIIYFKETASTNLFAKSLCTDNILVLTSFQKNGVGRFGRVWNSSPDKNLTFSLVKFLDLGIDEIHLVNFYSSYILFLTLNEILRGRKYDLSLKWPNDLLLNKKKIAGFLLDAANLKQRNKKFIIGVGLNVNEESFPIELDKKATSLKIQFNNEFDTEKILIKFIKNFYSNLNLLKDKKTLMNNWRKNSEMQNKYVMFRSVHDSPVFAATIFHIDDDGGLNIILNNGEVKKFYSGEISILY